MAWQAVIEAEDERTELLELTGRGCLVRIVVRDAQGRWTPSTMTWCPGLGASDFESLGPVSAPSAASTPAPEPAPTQSPPAPAAEPAAAPAPAPEAAAPTPEAAPPAPAQAAPSAQPAPTAPDAVELIKAFTRVQAAVVKVFRSQIRKASGELGYLEDAPRVSSFAVPEHGSWVSRIDDTTVLLTSGKKVIELTLPKHLRDDGIDPNGLSRWLKSNKVSAVAYKGVTYDIEPATLDKLIKQLCVDGVLRLFRSHPAVYIVAA